MNLRETILEEHSKAQTTRIVNWVGDSQERFDALFRLFLNDEYRVVQRAALAVSYCVIDHPSFIRKHFKKLLSNLEKAGQPSAVKRNTVRLLQHIEIPEKFEGQIIDLCIRHISSNDEMIAVKAFSLSILQNLLKKYPEIKDEVRIIIEDRWPIESAAFKSRARKFLNSK